MIYLLSFIKTLSVQLQGAQVLGRYNLQEDLENEARSCCPPAWLVPMWPALPGAATRHGMVCSWEAEHFRTPLHHREVVAHEDTLLRAALLQAFCGLWTLRSLEITGEALCYGKSVWQISNTHSLLG